MKRHARLQQSFNDTLVHAAKRRHAEALRAAASKRQRIEKIKTRLLDWIETDLRTNRRIAWALCYGFARQWLRFGSTLSDVSQAAAELLEEVLVDNPAREERDYLDRVGNTSGDPRGRYELLHADHRSMVFWNEWAGPVPREQVADHVPSGIDDRSYPTVRQGWIGKFEGFVIEGGRAYRGYGPRGTPEHCSSSGYVAMAVA